MIGSNIAFFGASWNQLCWTNNLTNNLASVHKSLANEHH